MDGLSCYYKLLSRFMFFLIRNMKLCMCTVNLKYFLSVYC